MKLGDPLEISEIQQVIRRILAELERLFHNLHCHFKDNGYAGLQELRSPNFRSCRSAASSSDSAFLCSLQIPASP
jgi:hypothetical protein